MGDRIQIKENSILNISVIDVLSADQIWKAEELYQQKIRIKKLISKAGSTCLAYEGELLHGNRSDRSVIVKEFNPKNKDDAESLMSAFLTGYKKQRELSERERLAELIVKPLMFGRSDETCYIISEKHPGRTLELKAAKTLEEKLHLLEQLTDVYILLEKEKCIFMDVCPDNILCIDQGKKVKRLYLFDMNGVIEEDEVPFLPMNEVGRHREYEAPYLKSFSSTHERRRKYISYESTWYSLGLMTEELLFEKEFPVFQYEEWNENDGMEEALHQFFIKKYKITRSIAGELVHILKMLIPPTYPSYRLEELGKPILEIARCLDKLTKRLHYMEYTPKEKEVRANETYLSYQLLESYPIFQYAKKEGEGYDLSVCLIGSDSMRSAMVHALISVVQMLDSRLSIHLIGKDAIEFWKEYTSKEGNSGLPGAVVVYENGKKNKTILLNKQLAEEPLAHIYLHTEESNQVVKQVIDRYDIRYILIYHEELHRNLDQKEEIRHFLKERNQEKPYFIGYLDEGEGKTQRVSLNDNVVCRPIYTNKETYFFHEADYEERMKKIGLAVHSYYYKMGHPFASDKEIEKDYEANLMSQESSQRCGLHLIYKLASIGITDKKDPELLKIIYDKIFSEESGDNRERLAWLEHRSWIGYMLTRGTVPLSMDEFSCCAYKGGNRWKDETDPDHMRHPLLVSSRSKEGLTIQDFKTSKRRRGLDVLDQTSLMMHEATVQIALARKEKIDNQLKLIFDGMKLKNSEIKNCSRKLKKAKENCYNAMMNPDLDWRPVLFEWNAVSAEWFDLMGKYFPESMELKQEWGELEEDMAPVLDALKCTDYKKKDLDVIDAIPHMLADIWEEVRENMVLIKPVTKEIWDNIGSTLLLEPKKLVLLAGPEQEVSLSFYRGFLKKRGLGHIEISRSYAKEDKDRIYLDLTGLGKKEVYDVCQDSRWKGAILFDLEDGENESWNCTYMSMLVRDILMTVPEACYLLGIDSNILNSKKDMALSRIRWEEYGAIVNVKRKCKSQKWNLFAAEMEHLLKLHKITVPLHETDFERKETFEGASLEETGSMPICAYQFSDIYGTYLKETGLLDILEELEEKKLIADLSYPRLDEEDVVSFATKHRQLAKELIHMVQDMEGGDTKRFRWELVKIDKDKVCFENESLFVEDRLSIQMAAEEDVLNGEETMLECLRLFHELIGEKRIFQNVKMFKKEDGIFLRFKFESKEMKCLFENQKNMDIVKEYLDAVRNRRFDDVRIITYGKEDKAGMEQKADMIGVADGIVEFAFTEQSKSGNYKIKRVTRKI